MKRLSWLIAIGAVVLFATPAFAQDDDFGGGLFSFDPGFDNPAGGGGNRGAAQGPDRLVGLRNLLQKANTPLTKDQEKTLNTLLGTEFPVIQTKILKLAEENGQLDELYRDQGGQGAQGRGFQGGGRGGINAGGGGGQRSGGGGGQRGAGGGLNAGGQGRGQANRGNPLARILQNDPDGPVALEVYRMNDDLVGKVTALVKPDQQAVLKKYQREQIGKRGGLEALKLTMEDAGAPLTPEQIPQIQPFYEEQSKARTELVKAAQPGRPDQAKLSALELQTLTKVLKVLNAAQKKALADSMAKAKP